ncbi:MAG: cytochrome P450 [Myxococcales bacterium]|nr:cytochrome P450 [Myxococcales bacterium]
MTTPDAAPFARSLPVAPGLPLVGSVGPMMRDPVRFLVDTHQALGPVFRLRVLNRRFVVMAGVEANQFVTRNERSYLASGPVFGGFGRELGGELFLASADGATHKRLRRIQTGSYAPAHVEGRCAEVVHTLRRRLGGLQPGQRLDVQRLFQLVLAEQVGLLLHNDDGLAHILDDLIRVFRTALNVKVIRQWPALALEWPAYRRSKRRILDHAAAVAAAHRDHPSAERQDLVDDILAAVERGDTIQEENVRLLTLGPLFGGIDTASNTAAFALHAILSKPAVRARVMAEIDAVFADGDAPAWDAFNAMPALRGVMMETLRMYPVAYLASRAVIADFEFAGHPIAAGEHLFVATAVPHFLPELFPDPYTFDIDRYGPERREHTTRGAFAPFGTGVHACLGARFAQSQIMITLATLLRVLDLELDPPGYTLRTRSNPVTMPVGLSVRVLGVRDDAQKVGAPWPAFSVNARRGLLSR